MTSNPTYRTFAMGYKFKLVCKEYTSQPPTPAAMAVPCSKDVVKFA